MENGRAATSPARRSPLDLGPRARGVFALAYVVVMGAVVVGAQYRPDHTFGFQMFNETSTLNIQLFRRVRGQKELVPIVGGAYQTRAPDGSLHEIRWNDRIHDRVLGRLDRPQHAKYGLDGQLFRLELALEDFVKHLDDDAETKEIVAVVETSKNGRPGVARLKAARR